MDATSRRLLTHLALALTFALPAFAQEAHVANLTGHAASGKKNVPLRLGNFSQRRLGSF